jgi:hypothetical protein
MVKMLLLEGYISNITCARYYFLYVEFSDFYVNQSLAEQTITFFFETYFNKLYKILTHVLSDKYKIKYKYLTRFLWILANLL